MIDGNLIGDDPPLAGRQGWRAHESHPELSSAHQLRGIGLAKLMELAGLFQLRIDAVAVNQIRLDRIDVVELEDGSLVVTRHKMGS